MLLFFFHQRLSAYYSKGRIYRCLKRDGKHVILKAFRASDPDIDHEYRMLRHLHHHPNMFVQLHTAVTVGAERVGLEREYINIGVPFCPASPDELQCYMRSLLSVRLAPEGAVTHDCCQALHVLHTELRMIHGDIKPDNVLYQPRTRSVKLIDFESADFGPVAAASACYLHAMPLDPEHTTGKPTMGCRPWD